MNREKHTKTGRGRAILDRVADRVDLAIDVMTLGQYGLERVQTPTASCSHRTGGQGASPPRHRHRGSCEPAAISWDWPRRCGTVAPR